MKMPPRKKKLTTNNQQELRVNALNSQVSSLRQNLSQALLGISHDGKRDLNDVYGYPSSLSGDVGFSLMYAMSKREGIANRLTFGTARTCWRDGFEVFDSGEDDAKNVLEDEITRLNKQCLVNKIERADILNRIGPFSVLFVGVPDGLDPWEPVGAVSGDGFKSIYFKAFAYDGVQINSRETDPKNPRFGLPLLYSVQRMSRGDTEKDNELNAMTVHWSRIIHMSEGSLDSDVEGMGYLEPIYNRILDLNKTCGGAAEAYFRNAKGKIAFEVNPEYAGTTDKAQRDALDEGAQKFTNEYQDHIFAAGSTVKAVDTPHASPLDTVKTILWEIAGYSGYPIRVLTGEGSGQLAGSEDQLALNAIIADRQKVVCGPWLVHLFEILSKAGMVKWDDKWVIKFPLQSTTTEGQQVELDNKKADTLLKIATAKSQIGGDEIDVRSAMDNLGLKDVVTDSLNSLDRDNEGLNNG